MTWPCYCRSRARVSRARSDRVSARARILDMPAVDVYIVASGEAPTGVGEPGVPAVAPAISNAIFAASGRRLRSLPFSEALQQGA
jgi:isoquinoline 1-oxidoreductase subunit beta